MILDALNPTGGPVHFLSMMTLKRILIRETLTIELLGWVGNPISHSPVLTGFFLHSNYGHNTDL